MGLFRKVRILKINPDDPEEEAISIATEILREGGLVAFPTETVYGLGANLKSKKAVERVYAIKKRPEDKPLTVHISDTDIVKKTVGEIPVLVQKLINRFWPGPLTVILNAKDGSKVGFRMPANKVALALLDKSGVPVVAPSANLSGGRPPRNTSEVISELNDNIDMILDGGPTAIGIESTVLDATTFPYRIVREGAISKSAISDAWHEDLE